MKSLRFTLSVVLMSLTAAAFAQSDAHMSSAPPVTSEAQKSFTTLKSLAGECGKAPSPCRRCRRCQTASRCTFPCE